MSKSTELPKTENDSHVHPEVQDKLSLDTYTKDGFKIITEGIRIANALPTEKDWNFYKCNESFSKILNDEGDRLIRLMNTILRKYDVEENLRNRCLEEKIELLVEANDAILEKVGDNLDEMNGIKKKHVEPVEYQTVSVQLPINGSWNRINKAAFSVSSSMNSQVHLNDSLKSIHLLTGKNIIRPQKLFKDKIENSNNYPWHPRITEKPNSLKPLALFLEKTEFGEAFCHPYMFELERFTPSSEQLTKTVPVKPKPTSETPLFEVTTPEQLNDLVDELRKHSIFAVDLENHSYRTFMGITCLMQISTTNADYLVDTLELRDKLFILNEVFTKPSIIKVFHGADNDIQWLQRDLSLYVVNMFDTHQAAKQLGYSGLSLSYLLNRFCKFVPNKQFQLADWRIRPLPIQLKNYAREDTHFLIYLYHMLKNELLEQGNGSDNILKSVIQRSTDICKKIFYKPILHDDSHLDFYRKSKRLFDNRQMFALKELYHWRDKISREEDESTGYVLPNHMLLQISESLPREVQGILASCNPIPPLVRSNLLELHQIVLRAREQSIEKPIMKEDNRSLGSTQEFTKINIESPLYCPHDLTKQQEFRDDHPTLLGGEMLTEVKNEVTIESNKPVCTIFNTPAEVEDEAVIKIHNLKFLGPYERYKLVKPFIQAEEEKEKAAEDAKNDNKDDKEDKSVVDRIALLHEHFVKVSQDTDQKVVEDNIADVKNEIPELNTLPQKSSEKSLVSMGGTKKRKRDESVEQNSYHPHYNIPENQLHTPVPNINPKKRFKRPKRNFRKNTVPKFKGLGNTESSSNQNFNKNFGNYKQQQQNNYQQQQQNQQLQQDNYQQPQRNKRHRQQQKNDRQQQRSNYDQQHEDNYDQHQNEPHQQNLDGKKKKRRFNKKKNMNETKNQYNTNSQSPGTPGGSNFAPFDYSAVDYRQFRGGAGGTNSNKKFQSKFKGKNKNKMSGGKGNNKFFTFSNRKGNERKGPY